MACEHVGKQAQCQSHGPGDESGQELQRDDEPQQVPRHTLWDEGAFEETSTELVEPCANVDAPRENGEAVGEPDVAEGREHENEELAKPVVDQEEREQAE